MTQAGQGLSGTLDGTTSHGGARFLRGLLQPRLLVATLHANVACVGFGVASNRASRAGSRIGGSWLTHHADLRPAGAAAQAGHPGPLSRKGEKNEPASERSLMLRPSEAGSFPRAQRGGQHHGRERPPPGPACCSEQLPSPSPSPWPPRPGREARNARPLSSVSEEERATAGACRRRTASGPRTGTGRRCIQKARRHGCANVAVQSSCTCESHYRAKRRATPTQAATADGHGLQPWYAGSMLPTWTRGHTQ